MRKQTGIAFITAMLIAAVVTAGAVALAATQQFDTRRAENVINADRAQLAIIELESRARGVLRDDTKRNRFDALDEPWAKDKLRTAHAGVTVRATLHDLQGRFNLTNLSDDALYGDVAGSPAEGEPPTPPTLGTASVSAAPTEGAVATGKPAAPGERTPNPQAPNAQAPRPSPELQLRALFKALELPVEPIQAVLDWIDQDTDTRFPNGAEDDYYTELEVAYRAANRPLSSERELLLIKGITPEIFRKLAPFVVCLPRKTALNVNTARQQTLMSLDPSVDASAAALLVRARTAQPFLSAADFLNHPILKARRLNAPNIGVASEYFELRAVADNARFELTTRSLLNRQGQEVAVLRRWRDNFDD